MAILVLADKYLFHDVNSELRKIYRDGFDLSELMEVNSGGVKTHRDKVVIDFTLSELSNKIIFFFNGEIPDASIKEWYGVKEKNSWQLADKKDGNFNKEQIEIISYRPFDNRFI